MTYYRLYDYITALVSSRIVSIGIATTSFWQSLFLRLNTVSGDAECYLVRGKREARKEYVQHWSNSFAQGSFHYQGYVNHQTLVVWQPRWLRHFSWRRWLDAFLGYALRAERPKGVCAFWRNHGVCDSC